MALPTAVGCDWCGCGGFGGRKYASVRQEMIASLSATEEADGCSCGGFGGRKCTSVGHEETTSLLATEEAGLDDSQRAETISEQQKMVACDAAKDEGKEVPGWLPDDVMEKIIARLPFHCLFQARLLSVRLASIILSTGSFETYFQREMMANSLSSKWDSFCPVYVGLSGLVGYNLVSNRWQKMLSLSYLPISEGEFSNCRLGNIAGALVCLYRRTRQNTKLNVWVTNPLNRTWNLLHPYSLTSWSKIVLLHLESVDASAYRLIVITTDHIRVEASEGPDLEIFLGAQIYDSARSRWTRYHPCPKRINFEYLIPTWGSALIKDTLYMLGQTSWLEPLLVAYNVKDEVWSTIAICSPEPNRRFWSEALLLSCGSTMMLVNVKRDRGCVVTVYKLNSESEIACPYGDRDLVDDSPNFFWTCTQLSAKQMPLPLTRSTFSKVASDDRCLYFFVSEGEFATCEQQMDARVFDLHAKTWRSLEQLTHKPLGSWETIKLASSAFRPGLNPFINA